jgi:ferredoxin-like protein FixX
MIRGFATQSAVLLFAMACVPNNQRSNAGRSSLDATCPATRYTDTDRASPDLSVSSRANAEFVSFIVDGQRAAWNLPNSTQLGIEYSEGPMPRFNPPIDPRNIQSIKILQPTEAKRLYNACPGVLLAVVTTKAGDWRPPQQ